MNLLLAQACSGSGLLLAGASNVSVQLFGTCFLLVILPGLQALVCWHVINCFRVIPEKYRLQEPNLTWLLMVPVFNLYWNFKVYPALAESYQAYYYSHGIADVEDCGESLARWYCICFCLSLIPCLGAAAAIAALVLIILFLIRTDDLKKRTLAGIQTR